MIIFIRLFSILQNIFCKNLYSWLLEFTKCYIQFDYWMNGVNYFFSFIRLILSFPLVFPRHINLFNWKYKSRMNWVESVPEGALNWFEPACLLVYVYFAFGQEDLKIHFNDIHFPKLISLIRTEDINVFCAFSALWILAEAMNNTQAHDRYFELLPNTRPKSLYDNMIKFLRIQ